MQSRPTPPNSLQASLTPVYVHYELKRQVRKGIISARTADEYVAAQQMAQVEEDLRKYDVLPDAEKPEFYPIFLRALDVPPYAPTDEEVEASKTLRPQVFFVSRRGCRPERV